MTIDELHDASIADVTALRIAELAALQTAVKTISDRAKRCQAILDGALEQLYGKVNAPGTSHRSEGNFAIKIDAPKKVAWDQAKLTDAATEITNGWNEPLEEYIGIEYKVSENAYKAWPAAIKALFTSARTESIGKVKVTITEKED